MRKSEIKELPVFFDRYIALAPDIPVLDALEASKQQLIDLPRSDYRILANHSYAIQKWTVNEVWQHILDNERIQSYRALRFARMDNTPLPGYDEQRLAASSYANDRSFDSILDELLLVRESTIQLYKSFHPASLHRSGMCFQKEISVLALGFVMVGHQLHHLQVLEEKYLKKTSGFVRI